MHLARLRPRGDHVGDGLGSGGLGLTGSGLGGAGKGDAPDGTRLGFGSGHGRLGGLAGLPHDGADPLVQRLGSGLDLRDLVCLLLHEPDPALPIGDWLLSIPAADPGLAPLAEILTREQPLCGRLTPAQLAVLFADRCGQVASCALLPLHGQGLLAIGSPEANRFHPGQGTFFLELIGETVSAALRRFAND